MSRAGGEVKPHDLRVRYTQNRRIVVEAEERLCTQGKTLAADLRKHEHPTNGTAYLAPLDEISGRQRIGWIGCVGAP